MRSAWRGEKRSASAPNRAMSDRGPTIAIISIAQHERPMGIGQSEFLRPQLISASSREVNTEDLPSFTWEEAEPWNIAAGLSIASFIGFCAPTCMGFEVPPSRGGAPQVEARSAAAV